MTPRVRLPDRHLTDMVNLKMTPEEFLARIQPLFEDGDKGLLLEAVCMCVVSGIPLPEWAKEAFLAAHDRASKGEIDSWDEVFGKPWGGISSHSPPNPIRRRKTRWMESRSHQIWVDVSVLRKRGMSIEAAFAKVAATRHMTVPTVRRFYYNTDRLYKQADLYNKMGPLLSQMGSDFEKP